MMKTRYIMALWLVLMSVWIGGECHGFACGLPVIETDTIMQVKAPSRLVITENEKGMRVSAECIGGNDSVIATAFTEYLPEASVKSNQSSSSEPMDWFHRYSVNWNINAGREQPRWDVSVSGVALGLTNSLDQTPAGGLQWSKSIEICWMSCVNVNYNFSRSRVSLGLGFDWRNYKITTSDKRLVHNGGAGMTWGSYPEGMKGIGSRLKVFSLQLPLLYSWSIPKSALILKAGPIFNFNTYASLKSIYEDASGNRIEDFTKKLSPRIFTTDFFGSVSYKGIIGVYVRYSPMKVMDASGLNFRPLTVGVTFGI